MKKQKSKRVFYLQASFIITIALIVAFMSACKGTGKVGKSERVQMEVSFVKEGEVTISNGEKVLYKGDVEIADDQASTTQGLMYRSSMEKDQGMYFIFPEQGPQSFWMRNTRISLDIIYIDSAGYIVSIAENARPYDETSYPSEGPAMYVLELLGGSVTEYGIQKGDKVEVIKITQ